MKISVDRQEFERALFIAQNVAQAKGSVQVLSYVKLDAADDRLTLEATDLDLSMVIHCSAEVEEPGSAVLQARTLYDMVRKGINPQVLLQTDGGQQIQVDTGTSYKLVGIDPAEFPTLPDTEERSFLRIEAGRFMDGVKKTIYAASDNDARVALNALYIEPLGEGTIRFAATDGHRLALVDLEGCEGELGSQNGVILARKNVLELVKSLPDRSETISIGLYDRYVLFRWSNVSCTLRLVDSEFPNYRQVIPTNLPHRVEFDRVALLDSIDRVGAVANDRFSGLKFAFSEDTLELSCNNFEQGESRDLMMIEYKGEPVRIGFNIRYVQAMLQSIGAEKVIMHFRDQLSATIWEAPEEGVQAIIMPLRI